MHAAAKAAKDPTGYDGIVFGVSCLVVLLCLCRCGYKIRRCYLRCTGRHDHGKGYGKIAASTDYFEDDDDEEEDDVIEEAYAAMKAKEQQEGQHQNGHSHATPNGAPKPRPRPRPTRQAPAEEDAEGTEAVAAKRLTTDTEEDVFDEVRISGER